MPFFALALAGLSLAALFADAPDLLHWPVIAMLSLALIAGLWVGMGRAQTALAFALAAAITFVSGWSAPGIVLLAAGAGTAWGRPKQIGLWTSAPLLMAGALGFGAALAPDRAFDPAISAGLAALLLAVLPLVRMGAIGVTLAGSGAGLAWGLAGFGTGAIAAAPLLALVALLGRRIPARALCMAMGLVLGGGCGVAIIWAFSPVASPSVAIAHPLWPILAAGAALIAAWVRRAAAHSHASGALIVATVAAFWAPLGAAAGLAVLALVAGALCAPRRVSLFGRIEVGAGHPPSSGPYRPWIGRAWRRSGPRASAPISQRREPPITAKTTP